MDISIFRNQSNKKSSCESPYVYVSGAKQKRAVPKHRSRISRATENIVDMGIKKINRYYPRA